MIYSWFSLSPVCETGPMCLVLIANSIINWYLIFFYKYRFRHRLGTVLKVSIWHRYQKKKKTIPNPRYRYLKFGTGTQRYLFPVVCSLCNNKNLYFSEKISPKLLISTLYPQRFTNEDNGSNQNQQKSNDIQELWQVSVTLTQGIAKFFFII